MAVESTGVIWIATSNGAVRFDPIAQSWHTFTVADGLAANDTRSVFIARDGRIILGTWAKGISVRDPAGNSFRFIPTVDNDFTAWDKAFEDSAGNIWVSGFGSKLYRLAPGAERLEAARAKVPSSQGGSPSEADLSPESIVEGPDRRLWAATAQKLFYFDASADRWLAADLTSVSEALAESSPLGKPSKDIQITAIAADDRSLWLIVDGRLAELQPDSMTAKLISSIDGVDIQGSRLSVAGDRDRIWVALKGYVYYRDAKDGMWRNVAKSKDPNFNDNTFKNSVPGHEGGIWIADDARLLLRVGPDGGLVGPFPAPPVQCQDLWALKSLPRHPSSIPYSLGAAGICRFDLSQSRWHLLATRTQDLTGNKVRQLQTDADGNLWTGVETSKGNLTTVRGLQRLDLESGAWTMFSNRPWFDRLDSQTSRLSVWIFGGVWEEWKGNFLGLRPKLEWELPQSVTAILDSGTGIVWGARRDAIQKCFWASRTCAPPTPVSSLTRIAPVTTIIDGGDGTIWLGGKAGVVRYHTAAGTDTFVPIEDSRPSDHSKELADDLTVSALFLSSDKRLLIGTNRGLFELNVTDPKLIVQSGGIPDRIGRIGQDKVGNLWLQANGGLVRLDAAAKSPRSFFQVGSQRPSNPGRESSSDPTLPDAKGGIWSATPRGLSRQGWNEKGFPGRTVDIPFFDNMKDFARVTTLDSGELVIWQTRPTGLILRKADRALTFPHSIAYPITAFERANKGGLWVGHALGGLSLHLPNGQTRRISTTEGLPDASILSVSPIPKREDRVWVGTNDGAALVSADDFDRPTVTPLPRSDDLPPGPVDVVSALPDGGAWLAYNSISRDFFLKENELSENAIASRQKASLVRVSPEGNKIGQPIIIARGDVLALTISPSDSNVLWVGATSGLYRLRSGETELTPVTAKGTLRAGPVRELHVDQAGVVWMGADAEGPDLFANLIGYNPDGDSVQNFTPDRDGLPFAQRIDSIDFAPENKLAVFAGGQLVVGQLIVPASRLYLWIAAALAIGLLLGLAAVLGYGWHKKRRVEIERFRPLVEAASNFFTLLGRKTQLLDFRTVLVSETGLAYVEFSGAAALPAGNEGQKVPVRCAADDLVPVEEVQSAFKAGNNAASSNRIYSYFVYQRDLDPAATRQLDVYRLRNNAIIIPLSRPFLVAKLAEGVAAARSALDGMKRRYLGEHDLFDMRNALDEARFFFGRRALINELSGVLSRGEHAALIGPRKSGKSSLLNLLQQRMNQFPIAKMDMQLYSRTEDLNWPGQLFARIVEAYDNWGRARYGSRWPVPGAGNSLIAPLEFEAALRTRRERQRQLGSDLPLLVLIDEIERVLPTGLNHSEVQRFIRAAGTLRALGQEGGEKLLSLVVADRLPAFNRINTFAVSGADTNPLYRFFKEFYLQPLQFDECRDMLTEIGQAMGLTLDEEVVRRIYQGLRRICIACASTSIGGLSASQWEQPPGHGALSLRYEVEFANRAPKPTPFSARIFGIHLLLPSAAYCS